MLKLIPQNFDVNMCTGFQIWQFSVMYKKKCKQSKFRLKIHSKLKMWMLILNERYQQMQKILRCAYDVVSFTINRYFSFIEAVNLEQTLTVQ